MQTAKQEQPPRVAGRYVNTAPETNTSGETYEYLDRVTIDLRGTVAGVVADTDEQWPDGDRFIHLYAGTTWDERSALAKRLRDAADELDPDVPVAVVPA